MMMIMIYAVFIATFNNISAISWRSVLLVDEHERSTVIEHIFN